MTEYTLSGNRERNFYFSRKWIYNLRSGSHLARKNIRTTQYGIESISNLRAEMWNLLLGEIKTSTSFRFQKWKVEMSIQALSDIYKRYRLYLISLRHMSELPLFFKLKLKSLWESYEMKSSHIRKNLFNLICRKIILYYYNTNRNSRFFWCFQRV